MSDRDVSGSDVGNHLRDEERIVFRTLLSAVDSEISGFLLESVQTSDASREDYAHAVFVDAFVLEPGVGDGLVGCSQGIHGVKIELAHLATVEMIFRLVAFHLAGELRLELRGVEVCDRAGAAYSLLGVFPGSLHVVSDGAQGSQSGHYYSL